MRLWVEGVSTNFMEGISVKPHPAGILSSLAVIRWGKWRVVYGTCEYWCCCLWYVQAYKLHIRKKKKSAMHQMSQYFQLGVFFFPCALLNACRVRRPLGAAAMPASSLGTFWGLWSSLSSKPFEKCLLKWMLCTCKILLFLLKLGQTINLCGCKKLLSAA